MNKDNGQERRPEQVRELRLKMKVSGMILDLVREAMHGELADVPNGDVQAICEALAVRVIAEVKEVA